MPLGGDILRAQRWQHVTEMTARSACQQSDGAAAAQTDMGIAPVRPGDNLDDELLKNNPLL